MNEEHLTVLRMVAEKKITAEEGDRLLEALEGGARPYRPSSSPVKDEEARAEEDIRSAEEAFKKAEEELSRAGDGAFGHEARERLRVRMEELRRRLEEKLRKHTQRLLRHEEERQRRHEERARRHEKKAHRNSGFHVPPIPPVPPIPAMPDIGKIVTRAMNSVNVQGIVNEAVRGTFVGTLAPESQTVTLSREARRLTVVSRRGGDLTLAHSDAATLQIEGRCGVSGSGEEVQIDGTEDDLTLTVPASIPSLCVKNSGGGDIRCRLGHLGGHEITLSTPGGGDIALAVPEDAAFEVSMDATGGGDIHTDLPIETSEQTASSVRGLRNGGGDNRIKLSAPGGGDIQLTRL